MEYFGATRPIYLNEEEKQIQRAIQACKGSKKNYQSGNCEVEDQVVPDFCFLNKKGFLTRQQEYSSSSSSESEQEYTTGMTSTWPKTTRRFSPRQQQLARLVQQTTSPKWITVVNLEGFYPTSQLTAKINPKCHILVIKGKQVQQGDNKLIRVVHLPENIYLENVKVQLTSSGQIIVQAPFVLPNELYVYQQRHYSSKWMPIHVTEYSSRKQLPYASTTDYGRFTTQCSKYFNDFSDMIHPEYIRDTVSGKLSLIIKVNTVGFLPQDILVRVDQGKRVLIVKADIKKSIGRRSGKMNQQQLLVEQEVAVKYFRREFVLPQWIDVTHIGYCVLENGLLTIQLPLVKSQQYKLQKYIGQVCNVMEGHLMKNHKWMTPMFV